MKLWFGTNLFRKMVWSKLSNGHIVAIFYSYIKVCNSGTWGLEWRSG